jgi:hypothetical protein
MVVKTHRTGRKLTGVEVGASNVRRYFPPDIAEVELLLDHLQIQCGLEPSFWKGEPEIHDPRLCAWLEAINFHGRPSDPPIPLALIPSGKNCFRLRPLARRSQPASKASFIPISRS